MGFFDSIVSAITGKPTKNDELTLLPYVTWIQLYNQKGFKDKTFMASSAIVQGVDILGKNIGMDFNSIYSYLKKEYGSNLNVMNNILNLIDSLDNQTCMNAFNLSLNELVNTETRFVVALILMPLYKNLVKQSL